MDRDLSLLGFKFFEESLPRDKEYLYKYFSTYPQKIFVNYFFVFGNYVHFVEHTGIYLNTKYLRRLRKRFILVQTSRDNAQKDGDFEKIAEIEMGKLPLPKTKQSKNKKRKKKQ